MRRFLLSVLAFFALLQMGLGANTAQAQSIEITNEVWGSFQQYLGRIGVTNPGAFAVSRDGGSSYYFYCGDPVCRSGTTYRHEAMRRCEDMTGRECVIFALRREIQVPYTIEPKSVTPTPPSQPTAFVPAPEEAPFESPLADGTIVLSHKVMAELEGYLAAVDRQRVAGFFYVSPNGRETGAYVCDYMGAADLPLCPMKPSGPWTDPKLDRNKVKQRAADMCEAASDGDCIMLYADDMERARHKLTDNPAPAPVASVITPAPSTAAPEPEEPPFESPLADGTIVLSRKVAKELDTYLAGLGRQGIRAYFYVSPDGRSAGAYACDITGAAGVPLCPMKPMPAWSDQKPDPAKVKQRALDACQATNNAGSCVMLYANDSKRQEYKVVE